MRVAVGQRQSPHPLRVRGGEDLRDPAAAVVAHEIHLIDLQGVDELRHHLGIRGDRHILLGLDLGLAVREQIERDAAPRVGERLQLVSPEMSAEEDAVDEQGHRAGAVLDVADDP